MRERRKEMEDIGQRAEHEVLLSKSRGHSSHKMSQVVNACVQLFGH
jgi:hypothetical protein